MVRQKKKRSFEEKEKENICEMMKGELLTWGDNCTSKSWPEICPYIEAGRTCRIGGKLQSNSNNKRSKDPLPGRLICSPDFTSIWPRYTPLGFRLSCEQTSIVSRPVNIWIFGCLWRNSSALFFPPLKKIFSSALFLFTKLHVNIFSTPSR